MAIAIRSVTPLLEVFDMPTSIAFYRRTLGCTGQLVGLSGKMAIIITDGKHSYDFEYTIAETP